MDTLEHKDAGDKVRVEQLGNPYLRGGKDLNPNSTDTLYVTMMRCEDGVPVPLPKLGELSAGDIVAMAGDYYTSAGWGRDLQIPDNNPVQTQMQQMLNTPIIQTEADAFQRAFDDLASPDVKKADIESIKEVESTTYIPFSHYLNDLVHEAIYATTVNDYGKKLNENIAHFAPWSTRAYLVGHQAALKNAHLAHMCKQLEIGKLSESYVDTSLQASLQCIEKDPVKYGFKPNLTKPQIYRELSHRYHALAVAQDLFVMHFYSDHFAGGHMSRVDRLRTAMPEQFGILGGILINNMHNEDNTNGVTVKNHFSNNGKFELPQKNNAAHGDSTYQQHSNDENVNMLINGMTNSLGDLTDVVSNGTQFNTNEYGGLKFIPEVDYTKRQNQPLLVYGPDGKVYSRQDVSRIEVLSPSEYQKMLQNPTAHGYEELTGWGAFVLTLKLRIFGFIYSPEVVKPSGERAWEIAKDEKNYDISETLSSVVQSPSAVRKVEEKSDFGFGAGGVPPMRALGLTS